MRVYFGEEEGQREHFEDGTGVSTVSVSIELELAQRTGMTADKTSPLPHVRHISKKKRVSFLSPLAKVLQR